MGFISKFMKPKYTTLNSNDSFDNEDASFVSHCTRCRQETKSEKSRSCTFHPLLWVLIISHLIVILITITIYSLSNPNSFLRSSYTLGFSTELDTARSQISYHKVLFTGNLNFFPNGTTYLEGTQSYAGPPTDEMDENWAHLLHNRYFYLTESEVLSTWGPSGLSEYYYHLSATNTRRYIGGLDVLHTLHCVNQLRQTLDREYYPKAKKQGSLHLYHCIDHIRQWVMCSADFTPIPARWHEMEGSEGKDSSYVDTDQTHTCRDFGRLWEWVQGREAVYKF